MLSNELLVDAIKSGATNEEIYELVRSIYGEAMKKTYYSLLNRDKYYQSLLSFHNIFIIVLPQMIIEILITYVMSFMSTYLSIQSFKLTFIQKDNFSLKYLFNYILNYLIIICFLIFISALLKIYLI